MVSFTKEKRLLNIIKGFLVICLYFGLSLFKGLPFSLLGIDTDSIPIIIKEIYNFFIAGLIILIIFLVFNDEFKKAWMDLKKNHLKYFGENFKYYLVGLLFMVGSNFIINIII